MRERVLDAIYKKLDEDPGNENLQRQITLLNMASICTIDSFCLDVVKNNFYELENVSPNFRIADTPEIELLKQEILDELFENKYLSEDRDFTKLINTYTSYRDDTPLKDLILNIYSYISSSPYPLKWLNEKIEMFNIKDELDKDFSQTPWGKVLLEEMDEELTDDLAILEDTVSGMEYEKELEISSTNGDLSSLESSYTTNSKEYRTEGYLVYGINLDEGFIPKGFIEHSEVDSKSYSGTNLIRGVYIKDWLFTVSQGMIKVNKLDTLEQVASVLIEGVE